MLVFIYFLEAYSESTKNTEYNLNSYDIVHTIKTGKHTQDTRLPRILNTWCNDVINNTYVITDHPMRVEIGKKIKDGHLVMTNCLKVLFDVILTHKCFNHRTKVQLVFITK